MNRHLLFALLFSLLYSMVLYSQDCDSIQSLNAVEHVFEQWDQYYHDNYFLQNRDLKGSGYKQFVREKSEFQINKAVNFSEREQYRWNVFQESNLNYLSLSEKQLVSEWINLGPNTIDLHSGRMTCHAFDPVNPDILWAGSAMGGIWRTTNGGELWEPMTDELPSMIISDLEVCPVNGNIILAGTGNDRFLSITMGPGVGVLKSTDNGETWYQTNFNYSLGQNISVLKLVWKPGSVDSVYMAASNGIWLSTDAGENWSLLRSGRASALVIDQTSTNNLYSVIRAEGVIKSTDLGITWNVLTNGIPQSSAIGFSSLAISISNPEILLASLSDANNFGPIGLYKTTDGGESWNQITTAPKALCAPYDTTSCYGWFVNVVGINPFDPEIIHYGGITNWRSTNGGISWTQVDVYNAPSPNYPGRTYVDQWDIGFPPADSNIVYAFNDGGVQRSTNKGAAWDKMNNGLVTALIHRIASSPTDTNLIIGGFQDHGLQKLINTNGNTKWTRWSDNDGTNVIIDPNNNNIFYGDYFVGHHRKSTNGGASPTSTFPINNGITESGILIAPLIMHPTVSTTLFTASTAKIYKTTNGGNLWIPVANIPNVNTLAVDQINPDIIYAHAYTNTSWSVWRSTNGGTDWISLNNSSRPTWRVTDLEVDPSVSGTLYATRNSASLNQDHIKKSTDFGETWTNITNNLPDIFVYALTISPYNSSHIYLATELGVYASTNGGNEWFPFNEGLPIVRTYDIHYHPLDRTIRIATIGRGAWKTKAIDLATDIEDDFTELPGDFKLYQNYPNPFNPSTQIKFDLQKESKVKIYIYDETGQKIETLFDGYKSAGTHTFNWNAEHDKRQLASGIYFLRLVANNFSQTIKMMYLK